MYKRLNNAFWDAVWLSGVWHFKAARRVLHQLDRMTPPGRTAPPPVMVDEKEAA